MTLRRRILIGFLLLATLGLASLAFAISRNAPCPAPDPLPDGAVPMKAIVKPCYGTADVLRLQDVARPVPADDEVLVKVHAASINPLDWHRMTGTPYVMRLSAGFGRPASTRLGWDFAGTVEAVGANVRRFRPGDAVFGGRTGSLAEYVAVREDGALAPKPATLDYAQAAARPIAAGTALQGLRDEGRIRPGHKVLVNGASGGVGTFAVQIAKAFGAEVTGVCSTRNVELVRGIGAGRVIDYTREDFTAGEERYDLILDNVGNHSLRDTARMLKPGGVLVIVRGPKRDPWLGPMSRKLAAEMLAPFVDEEMVMMFADVDRDALAFLGGLAEAGKLTPVIDRRYRLHEVADAMRYLGTGRARGKVVIDIAGDAE
jgi:NADPH:quinone reductase-like Zn-dependent oxidoreductase